MFKKLNDIKGGNALGYILGILAILVIVVLAVLYASSNNNLAGNQFGINDDMYQALFLANGEVYFGHLEMIGEDYVALEDIYYLRVTPTLQQSTEVDEEGNPVVVENSDEPQINLVKLGEELHGPEDRMVVPITSVIYWENLSADGQVSTAIAEAKETLKEADNADEENTEDEESEE